MNIRFGLLIAVVVSMSNCLGMNVEIFDGKGFAEFSKQLKNDGLSVAVVGNTLRPSRYRDFFSFLKKQASPKGSFIKSNEIKKLIKGDTTLLKDIDELCSRVDNTEKILVSDETIRIFLNNGINDQVALENFKHVVANIKDGEVAVQLFFPGYFTEIGVCFDEEACSRFVEASAIHYKVMYEKALQSLKRKCKICIIKPDAKDLLVKDIMVARNDPHNTELLRANLSAVCAIFEKYIGNDLGRNTSYVFINQNREQNRQLVEILGKKKYSIESRINKTSSDENMTTGFSAYIKNLENLSVVKKSFLEVQNMRKKELFSNREIF